MSVISVMISIKRLLTILKILEILILIFPFFMIYSGWSLTIFMDAIWWQQHLHNSQSARSRNGNPRVSQLALVVLLITSAGRLHPGRGRRGRRRPPTVIATPTPTRPLKPGGSTPQFTGVNRTRYLRRSSWVLSSIRILPSGKKNKNILKEVIFVWNWPIPRNIWHVEIYRNNAKMERKILFLSQNLFSNCQAKV